MEAKLGTLTGCYYTRSGRPLDVIQRREVCDQLRGRLEADYTSGWVDDPDLDRIREKVISFNPSSRSTEHHARDDPS